MTPGCGGCPLIGKLTSAYTAADLDSLIALLTDDVRLSMPPHPFEYCGRTVAARGLGQLFAHDHRYRLIETRANAQPPSPSTGRTRTRASCTPAACSSSPWPRTRQRHDHVHPRRPGPLRAAQDPARMNTRDPQPPAPARSDPGDGRPLPYLLGDRNDTIDVTVLPY